jgi:predicted nucleic acid-binding protein
MPDRVFFDTSVLVYLAVQDDARADAAYRLLVKGGVVNTQILNEFVNVARRKMRMDWDEIEQILADIRSATGPVFPLTVRIHEAGIKIARRYGYRIYDALIVAAALDANCTTLYSEDMQDGQRIGDLTIRNPFLVN